MTTVVDRPRERSHEVFDGARVRTCWASDCDHVWPVVGRVRRDPFGVRAPVAPMEKSER